MTREQIEARILEIKKLKLKIYKEQPYRFLSPIGKMEEFLDEALSGKYLTAFMSSANGTGKTTTIVGLIANLCFPNDNPFFQQPVIQDWKWLKRGRIVSDTTTIKETIIPMIEEMIPKKHYTRSKAGKEFWSKWKMRDDKGNVVFEWDLMTYEQDPKQFESANLGIVIFDEPPPFSIYTASIARLKQGGICLIFATPLGSNIGSAWLYQNIVSDPNRKDNDFFYMTASKEDACFDLDTEVMTPSGWKLIGDIKKGDNVYSVKQDGLVLEQEKVVSTVYYKNMDVLELGRGISCTPDHEVLSLRETKEGKNYKDLKLKKIQAQELYRGNRLISMIDSDNLDDRSVEDEDWARFMGWYLSEGCSTGVSGGKTGANTVLISQQNEPNRTELRELLSRTKYNWKEKESGDFFTKDKELYSYLFKLGNSHAKYIPSELLIARKNIREALFDALMKGDGSENKNSYRYVTASKRLADDVQILAISLGYSTSISLWKGKRKYNNKTEKEYDHSDLYCVYISKHKRGVYVQGKPVVTGKRDVACISVPNQNIIVRNKDVKKPLVVGNCLEHGIRGFLPHEQIEREMKQYPEEEILPRIFGEFSQVKGRVIKEYDEKIHVLDQIFDINKEDYAVVQLWDTHARVNEAIMWVAINRSGTAFIVDELWIDAGLDEMVAKIKEIDSRYRIVKRLIDPSAFNVDKRIELTGKYGDIKGVSFAHILHEKYGLKYEPASKRRADGITMIREALRYNFQAGSWVQYPTLFVFPHCTRTRWEFINWMWDDWRGVTAERKDPRDKPQDKNDHMMENLGRFFLEGTTFTEPVSEVMKVDRSAIVEERTYF